MLTLVLLGCSNESSKEIVTLVENDPISAESQNTPPQPTYTPTNSPTSTLTPSATHTRLPTHTPTLTPSPTNTPTVAPTVELSATPVLTSSSLVTQTWDASPVILTFLTRGEGWPFGVAEMPDLVIYRDGTVVHDREIKCCVERIQICELLNTITLSGYFTFDAEAYDDAFLEVTELGLKDYTNITVHGWMSRHFGFSGLNEALIIPELNSPLGASVVYEIATTFLSDNLIPIESDEYVLALSDLGRGSTSAYSMWNLTDVPLAELLTQAQAEGVASEKNEDNWGIIIDVELAERILAEMRQEKSNGFADRGHRYILDVRPLLPYETLASAMSWKTVIPAPDAEWEHEPMSCYPSDGVLEELLGYDGE